MSDCHDRFVCRLSYWVLLFAMTACKPSASTPEVIDWAGELDRADKAYAAGDFDAAVRFSSNAIEAAPTESAPYLSRAQALSALGRFEEAEADVNTAIKYAAPALAFALNQRSEIYLKLGRREQGMADLKLSMQIFELIKVSSNNAP